MFFSSLHAFAVFVGEFQEFIPGIFLALTSLPRSFYLFQEFTCIISYFGDLQINISLGRLFILTT